MMLPLLSLRLPLLLAAAVRVPVVLCAGTDGPVTIDMSDVYQQQRTCAFFCFKQFGDAGYPIALEIACATFKVQNKCFCRPDLQQQAHNYVFSCISSNCDNALDISVATKLYDDYCTSNGWIVTSTKPAPEPTGTGGPPASSSPPITSSDSRLTSTNAPQTGGSKPATPTTTSSSSSPGAAQDSNDGGGGGGTKLSGGELAGIIVGVVSAVATVIGVIFTWKSYKKGKEKSATPAPEVRGHPGPGASGWN